MRIYEHTANLRTKKTFLFFIAILLVFIDQLSKYLVRHGGGFYICNEGISFGLRISPVVFWVLWSTIIAAIIYVFLNHKHQTPNTKQNTNFNIQTTKQFWALGFGLWAFFGIWDLGFGILLILSGAVSNILDRLYFGCVIDFIPLANWSVFNLADAFITIGVIITLIEITSSKSQIPNKLQ